MPVFVRNNAPRIQGFNGMKYLFMPRGSVTPEGVKCDRRALTAEEEAFFKAPEHNRTFVALVQCGDLEIESLSLEEFLGVAPPKPTPPASALNIPLAVLTSATLDQADPRQFARVDLTPSAPVAFDPAAFDPSKLSG